MIRIINAADAAITRIRYSESENETKVGSIVSDIIAKVRREGDSALVELTDKYDGVKLENIEVSKKDLDAAYADADTFFIETLRQASDNIADFHKRQIHQGFSITEKAGIMLGQRVIPLDRVGIYVPGGTAAYPSSVLMNAIPARLAGVREIVMATPPGRDGCVPAQVLAAARAAGIDRVFMMGGAQAIAAMAYGTGSVPRVDKIVGPGNAYVAEAKRQVFGIVDIDMIAGPSEILVIADGKSDPRYIAADLLSQAEHDIQAAAVLITDSVVLAAKVQAEVELQLTLLPRSEIARVSIEQNGLIILSESITQAIELANGIAPEHLELCVDDPFALLPAVRNAGSVFLGRYAPEALGDYWAGPNHTLPTGGTARFSSPLSVDDFVKKSQFIYYTKDALGKISDRIADFAEREGLTAHTRSVQVRFEEGNA